MRRSFAFLMFASTAFAGDQQPATADWPVVRPVEVRKLVESGNARVRVAVLPAASDVPMYELRCNRSGARDADAEGGAEYYGLYQCRLVGAEKEDLLRAGAAWEDDYTTRAVFAFEQIVGPCKKDADFGVSRTFFVRGMKLVLTISNFQSPPVAQIVAEARSRFDFRFDFDVSIAPDARASTPRAKEPKGAYCGGIYVLDGKRRAVYEKEIR